MNDLQEGNYHVLTMHVVHCCKPIGSSKIEALLTKYRIQYIIQGTVDCLNENRTVYGCGVDIMLFSEIFPLRKKFKFKRGTYHSTLLTTCSVT